MDAAQASQVIRQTRYSKDSCGVISLFDGYAKRTTYSLVGCLHRIITLSLLCFNEWLKPLLIRPGKEPVSSVQEHDPYLESLLIALRGQK